MDRTPGQDIPLIGYRALAEFRRHIRSFLHFSEQQAHSSGLEPQQHQLLLAIKGLPEGKLPTVGEIAAQLDLRHHSAVELIDRAARRGLVARRQADKDLRKVLVVLTPKGEGVLLRLALAHRQELEVSGPALAKALRKVMRLRLGGRAQIQTC